MKSLVLTLIFILSSCGLGHKVDKRNLGGLYIGSGVEKYFLAQLPDWAQFSSEAACRLIEPVRYLNFENLYKSQAFSYDQLVQLQYSINKQLRQYKKRSSNSALLLQDESYIFYNTKERVLGGAKDFLSPNYSKINIIWIDPYVKAHSFERLRKFLLSERGGDAYPIFVSRCYSEVYVENWLTRNKLSDFGSKIISSAMFSPYNVFFKLGNHFELHIDKILKNKVLWFTGPFVPKMIKADFSKIIKL